MKLKLIIIIQIVINVPLCVCDSLATCHPSDFKYGFTECDEFNGRWRVSIPLTPRTCTGGAPNAPIRVDGCSISCGSGQFFNSTSLECQSCDTGYYSLGGGVRFESFKNISALGFRTTTETTHQIKNCIGWYNRQNFLESISNYTGGGCVSMLTYTVKIVKTGKLRFTYQYLIPDDLASAIIFTFHYQNFEEGADDSSFSDNSNIKFPSVTNRLEKWKTMEITMKKPGIYAFTWKSVTIGQMQNSYDNKAPVESHPATHSNIGIIRIKAIEIDGVAYASSCTPCAPGTYNDKVAAEKCKPCPANTAFAKTGAVQCEHCDKETQYAPSGSEKCSQKPICGDNDFYKIVSECDMNTKKETIAYKWIEPKICRDVNHILPNSYETECNATMSSKKRNQLCNAGMELTDDGKCQFCRENEYNDGTFDKCRKCPFSTAPLYALSYNIWHNGKSKEMSFPPLLSSQCVRGYDETECESMTSWQTTPADNDYIRTSPSALLDSFLILTLSIPGFRNPSGGEISFTFEIECVSGDKCEFIFVEARNKELSQQANIIKNWDGETIGMQSFKYRIEQNSSYQFNWIFRRDNQFQSHAKIHDIEVKDSLIGGAIKCNPCPLGAGRNCVPCPFGQYLETESFTELQRSRNRNRFNNRTAHNENDEPHCTQCPINTIINSSIAFPIDRNSCIHCGPGLMSNSRGSDCYSNCHVSLSQENYDLNQIKHPILLRGGRLFTAGGTQYYHLFNITFCGNESASCFNNITSFGTDDESGIRSMVCRSTVIPDGNKIYTTQSVSLGDKLIGITRNTSYNGISVHPEFITTNSDLHLYFITNIPTAACPNGRRVTLTIRCSPELEDEMSISTPKACPDATCDGCNFHLLVRTKTAAACRVCQTSDYQTVVGECYNGVQHIHYVNPKGCIISPNGEISIETRPCSVIPKQIQFGIILVSAVGVILLVLLFHFWKKNQRLEYKYCKLIENEKHADCCAEDDDEDDDDNETDVAIHGHKHKVSGESGYESIQLTKHQHDDVI